MSTKMRIGARTSYAAALVLVIAFGACGGDEDGAAGAGGSAGTGGTSGASGAGGGAGGTGGIAGATATVTGTVSEVDGGPSALLEGATVVVIGTSATATTDSLGRWTLEVPEGEIYLQASAGGYWSSIVRRQVPPEGLIDVALEVVPDAVVEGLGMALGRTFDETKGAALLSFDPVGAVGGQTAMLSEVFDFSFAFDDAGDPQLSEALLPGGDADLVFVGVEPTDTLTVTPESSTGEDCFVRFGATPPVAARSITEVDVPCQLSL